MSLNIYDMPATMESVKEWVLNKCKVVLHEETSSPFTNVVTPNNIPEFTIPKHLDHRLSRELDETSPPQSSGGSSHDSPSRSPNISPSNTTNNLLFIPSSCRHIKSAPVSPSHTLSNQVIEDTLSFDDTTCAKVDTNADPQSLAAMSLPHFKTRTSYGFSTLKQAPHTRRKESLFHVPDETIPNTSPLLRNASRRYFSSCDTVRYALTVNSESTDVDDYFTPSHGPFIHRSSSRRRNVSNIVSPLAILTPVSAAQGDISPGGSPSLRRSCSSSSSPMSTPEMSHQRSIRRRASHRGNSEPNTLAVYNRRRSSTNISNNISASATNVHLTVEGDLVSDGSSTENSPNLRRYSHTSVNSVETIHLKKALTGTNSSEYRPKSPSQTSVISSSHSCHTISKVGHPLAEYGEVKFSLQYYEDKKQLRVLLIKAENLSVNNRGDRAMNPYAKVYLMPGKIQKQTSSIVKHSRHPVYNEEFYFDMNYEDLQRMRLRIKMYNKCRNLRRHEFIGDLHVPIDNYDITHETRMWRNLERKDESEELGYLQISMCFEPKMERLSITILQAMDLPKHKLHGSPDPYVKVEVVQPGRHVDKTKRQTVIRKNTTNPVFKTTFTFIISPRIEDLNYTAITLTVCGHERLRHDDIIGQVRLGVGATEVSEIRHWSLVIQNPEQDFTDTHQIMEMED